MDEKIIIKSKRYDKVMRIVPIAIIAIGLIGSIKWLCDKIEYYSSQYNSSYIDWTDYYSSPFDMAVSQDGGFWLIVLPFFISLAVAAVVYFAYSKIEMTVTDKRVYGRAIFGKRVDLPLDSVSAVGTNLLKGVDVSTSSGSIKFICIMNCDQIHHEISKLLIERQNTKKEEKPNTPVVQEHLTSVADELAKYKALLDSGAITEEEYNEKKKQLLGL